MVTFLVTHVAGSTQLWAAAHRRGSGGGANGGRIGTGGGGNGAATGMTLPPGTTSVGLPVKLLTQLW